jgi:hypothetical protein
MSQNLRSKKARTFALTVTTAVQKLVGKNSTRTGLLVYNNGTATVYILSAQNLTSADGIPVAAGASYENNETTAELWIVAASGSQNVRVEEDTD